MSVVRRTTRRGLSFGCLSTQEMANIPGYISTRLPSHSWRCASELQVAIYPLQSPCRGETPGYTSPSVPSRYARGSPRSHGRSVRARRARVHDGRTVEDGPLINSLRSAGLHGGPSAEFSSDSSSEFGLCTPESILVSPRQGLFSG